MTNVCKKCGKWIEYFRSRVCPYQVHFMHPIPTHRNINTCAIQRSVLNSATTPSLNLDFVASVSIRLVHIQHSLLTAIKINYQLPVNTHQFLEHKNVSNLLLYMAATLSSGKFSLENLNCQKQQVF